MIKQVTYNHPSFEAMFRDGANPTVEIITDTENIEDLPDEYPLSTENVSDDCPVKEFRGVWELAVPIKQLRETCDVQSEKIGESEWKHTFTQKPVFEQFELENVLADDNSHIFKFPC